jgi:hypothetical protein
MEQAAHFPGGLPIHSWFASVVSPDEQIDALESVGNAGLNWAALEPYVSAPVPWVLEARTHRQMLRAENFQKPTSSQYAAGITYDPSCHSSGGPVNIQFDPSACVVYSYPCPHPLTPSTPAQFEHDMNSTLVQTLGQPYAFDLTCGNPAGAAPIANTRKDNRRYDAYFAYLYNRDVPNLTSESRYSCRHT